MSVRSNELLGVEKLPNGLTVVGQRMPGVESVAICFHVRTGSRDEPQDIAGVSHFLEHMMFKGTTRRSAVDISREFEEMGAEFNAFTWVESTVYYARVLGDQLPRAVDLLADMMRPALDEKEFETEKGVIIEEIARSEDQPAHELIHQLFANFFESHPLGNSVLGTQDTIRNMPVHRMREYHQRRYGANNIIFGIAGNFDWDKLLPMLEEVTRGWEPSEEGHQKVEFKPTPKVRVDLKPQFQQEHIAIASSAPKQDEDDTWAAELVASVLGDSTGSRLFWEVTQKGLVDSIETEYYGFDDAGLYLTYFSTSPDRAEEVLRVVRQEMQKLQQDGVDQDELDRAKVKAVADIVIGGEASHRRMFELASLYVAKSKAMSVDEIVDSIESVSQEDIRRVLERYPFTETFTVQAAGPLSDLNVS
ncbi:peptidase M16 domain protein [Thermobaculum terrenum ATCC BAA-798]|uniref:Peptidase M16 domain protein n=1 Tax=Thermobaculum terrenum (strain ATCC BAA-798 / CCMEE 7001 / YNP1) TaxID=525904 RepID=D1CDU3_THET1|nr:pitrilysin family protein [Thermobaculum terrenum]ACZ41099.1 peptidase M16 domain protein [Thermobaculum terrenum ATCC BAA-798]